MEYKTVYSPEELKDLCTRMKARLNSMPKELHLDDATYIPDLKLTVGYLISVVESGRTNITFSGQIYHLFRIEKKLEELENQ